MSLFLSKFPSSDKPVVENPIKNVIGGITPTTRYISEKKKTFYTIMVNNKPVLELITPEREPKNFTNWKDGERQFIVADAKKIKFESLDNGVIKITVDKGFAITQFRNEKYKGDKNPQEIMKRCKKYMQDSVVFYVDPKREEYRPNFDSSTFHIEAMKSTGCFCYPDIPLKEISQDQAYRLLKKLQSFYTISTTNLVFGLKSGSLHMCYNDHGLVLTKILDKDTGTKEVMFISASKGEIATCKLIDEEEEAMAKESEDLLYKQGYFNSKTHIKVALYIKSSSALPELYQAFMTKEGWKGFINGEMATNVTYEDVEKMEVSGRTRMRQAGKTKDAFFKFN